MKNWDMPGWAFGASYVYAWDAEAGKNVLSGCVL